MSSKNNPILPQGESANDHVSQYLWVTIKQVVNGHDGANRNPKMRSYTQVYGTSSCPTLVDKSSPNPFL